MEVSGQLHAPAALPQGKIHAYSGRPVVWCFTGRKIRVPCNIVLIPVTSVLSGVTSDLSWYPHFHFLINLFLLSVEVEDNYSNLDHMTSTDFPKITINNITLYSSYHHSNTLWKVKVTKFSKYFFCLQLFYLSYLQSFFLELYCLNEIDFHSSLRKNDLVFQNREQ
jgi:hypothetical protein